MTIKNVLPKMGRENDPTTEHDMCPCARDKTNPCRICKVDCEQSLGSSKICREECKASKRLSVTCRRRPVMPRGTTSYWRHHRLHVTLTVTLERLLVLCSFPRIFEETGDCSQSIRKAAYVKITTKVIAELGRPEGPPSGAPYS